MVSRMGTPQGILTGRGMRDAPERAWPRICKIPGEGSACETPKRVILLAVGSLRGESGQSCSSCVTGARQGKNVGLRLRGWLAGFGSQSVAGGAGEVVAGRRVVGVDKCLDEQAVDGGEHHGREVTGVAELDRVVD